MHVLFEYNWHIFEIITMYIIMLLFKMVHYLNLTWKNIELARWFSLNELKPMREELWVFYTNTQRERENYFSRSFFFVPFFLIIIFPKLVQWCFCCIFKYNHTVIIILVNHNLYISWHIDKVQLSVSSSQEFTQRALTRALTESSLPGILNHNENWQTMLLFCIQNATIKHAQ